MENDALGDQTWLAEVDQQPNRTVGGLQVRPQLPKMNWIQPLHRLELEHYTALSDHVESMSTDNHAVVPDTNLTLAHVGDATMLQLDFHCSMVHRFHESGAQDAMDGYGGPDQPTGGLLEIRGHPLHHLRPSDNSDPPSFLLEHDADRLPSSVLSAAHT